MVTCNDDGETSITSRRFSCTTAKWVFSIFALGFYATAQQLRYGSKSFAVDLLSLEDAMMKELHAIAPSASSPKRSLSQPEIVVANATTTTTIATIPNGDASDQMPKTLAIYFPQYHRDPINDKNWGENFTDWNSLRDTPERNRLNQIIPRPLTEAVTNAGDDALPPLGYYDLTDREPRETQALLAKKYGVDGFIYHHYWFYDPSNLGPTLAKPLEKMLEDGHPDLPFLLNWCAVKWMNVWMGKAIFQTIKTSKKRAITLQEQYFNATQDMIYQHYQWLRPFFHHPNYIRVEGQPAFLLYFYDARALPILECLRRFAIEDGFPGLHFIVGRSAHPEELYDTSHLLDIKGMDYQLKKKVQRKFRVDPTQFKSKTRSIHSNPPPNASWPVAPHVQDKRAEERFWDYNPLNQTMTYPYALPILTKAFEVPEWCTNPSATRNATSFQNSTQQQHQHPEITGVITTFDNTPRRNFKDSHIFRGSGNSEAGESPDEAVERFSKSYQAALYYQKCCVQGASRQSDDRFVVINAWNEWAEGMSIEPSNVYGYRWLEAIQAVKKRVQELSCVVDALGSQIE